jgi:inner membrane protein
LDSLTQLTLGAAVGEMVLGPKVGRKAMAWGAALATLPDLDVFIPMGGPVNDFVYHRGFSHSLLLLALLSPLLAWGITRIHPSTKDHYKGWLLLSFLVLQTSVLLDYLTIYGTQILWPFDKTPLAWPVFFIIDPLFTLPILSGVLAALFLSRKGRLGYRLNRIGLMVGLLYVVWAFGAKAFVDDRVREKLADQNIPYAKVIVSPAPFTTLLWRVVGIQQDQYFEAYTSLFDGDAALSVRHYPRHSALKKGLEDHPPVVKLQWFTRGYWAMGEQNGSISMTDLRMGSEPDYVFSFKVGSRARENNQPIEEERIWRRQDWRRLKWVWQRIWSPP